MSFVVSFSNASSLLVGASRLPVKAGLFGSSIIIIAFPLSQNCFFSCVCVRRTSRLVLYVQTTSDGGSAWVVHIAKLESFKLGWQWNLEEAGVSAKFGIPKFACGSKRTQSLLHGSWAIGEVHSAAGQPRVLTCLSRAWMHPRHSTQSPMSYSLRRVATRVTSKPCRRRHLRNTAAFVRCYGSVLGYHTVAHDSCNRVRRAREWTGRCGMV